MSQPCAELNNNSREPGLSSSQKPGAFSGLTTNYLNQYVEILLLLEMLPDMPECIEDILAWQPASYEEHVRSSQLPNSDIVLDSFKSIPAKQRATLEATTKRISDHILNLCHSAREAVEKGDRKLMNNVAQASIETVRPLITEIDRIMKLAAHQQHA